MGAALSQNSYPPIILSFIISVPSVILYLLEVCIMLICYRNFRSAFFRLFIARSICNFLFYFCASLPARFGRIGLFREFFESLPPVLLGFTMFFGHYTFHADNLSTVFILINRITLILFPISHTKIWKYFLPASLLIIFLAPLPFTAPLLSYDYFVRMQNDNWTFTFDFHRDPEKQYLKSVYISGVSGFLFCGICGVLNFLTIFIYRRTTKTVYAHHNRSQDNVESRLTLYAFITFAAQFVMSLLMIILYISSTSAVPFLYNTVFLAVANQFVWIGDLCNIVFPAWSLLWASSKVREATAKFLRISRFRFCVGKISVEQQPIILLHTQGRSRTQTVSSTQCCT
ncbi:srg family chemoreceptor domain-containing protein [Ditylenchus destructor]|uniref:Serpentine receptor class gamma n=1 Tax=Ditylenchus destructor TaxID=166010 RepID=A0AAD4QZP9_9BILA|nr:srg family chemoreceptor domain-containing protein [Ditylenchus destructor]